MGFARHFVAIQPRGVSFGLAVEFLRPARPFLAGYPLVHLLNDHRLLRNDAVAPGLLENGERPGAVAFRFQMVFPGHPAVGNLRVDLHYLETTETAERFSFKPELRNRKARSAFNLLPEKAFVEVRRIRSDTPHFSASLLHAKS